MSVRVINKDFKYQERQSDHDNYCAGFALAAILSDLNGDGTICKGEGIYRSLQKYPVTGEWSSILHRLTGCIEGVDGGMTLPGAVVVGTVELTKRNVCVFIDDEKLIEAIDQLIHFLLDIGLGRDLDQQLESVKLHIPELIAEQKSIVGAQCIKPWKSIEEVLQESRYAIMLVNGVHWIAVKKTENGYNVYDPACGVRSAQLNTQYITLISDRYGDRQYTISGIIIAVS